MTKLKLSSKMHIMIVISAVIIAVGLAMGLIFQFTSDGYFNYGADYSSYNCVVVDYAYMNENKDHPVTEVCENAFKEAGVSYYACTFSDTNDGGEYVYKFANGVDAEKIKAAKDVIHGAISEGDESGLNHASFSVVDTKLGGAHALSFGAIALASAVVFQFLYFAIRYGLTSALSALLADVHNLAIFVSLLAITRVPVGSTVFAFAALTVLMTMIGCGFLFDKVRKSKKDDNLAKLDAYGQVDACANESIKNIALSAVFAAAAGVVLFVLLAISALSVHLIVTSAILALLSAVASVYGTAFFTPSVYSRVKRIGDNFKANHTKKAKKNS